MTSSGADPDAVQEEVTKELRRLRSGDGAAEGRLFQLLYTELHDRARQLMSRQRADHTLQATALVNEAWLKLCRHDRDVEVDRTHFVQLATRAMRSVLVDHARARVTDKRGGGAGRIPIEDHEVVQDAPGGALLALDEALTRMKRSDPDLARVAELRLFGGLEHQEIAVVLGISTRTAERAWKVVQSMLQRELGTSDGC